MKRVIATSLAMLLTAALHADVRDGQQSYESCSLITSQYLTALQLMARGLSDEVLQQALPDITPQSKTRVAALGELVTKEGLTETYNRVNAEYSRCARTVYREHGLPPPASREAHFHFCAGENKVRHEILLAAMLGAPASEIRPQLAPSHQAVVAPLYSLYNTAGADVVYDNLASELKHCLNSRP